MCRVTSYIGSKDFGHLYDVVRSQSKYFEREKYWQECCEIYNKQFAIWDRLEGSVNDDFGSPGINLLCFHRHLKRSNHTSPYFVIREIREYLSLKIGDDIFCDWKFEQWEKQFYGGRFRYIMHDFKCLI